MNHYSTLLSLYEKQAAVYALVVVGSTRKVNGEGTVDETTLVYAGKDSKLLEPAVTLVPHEVIDHRHVKYRSGNGDMESVTGQTGQRFHNMAKENISVGVPYENLAGGQETRQVTFYTTGLLKFNLFHNYQGFGSGML